MAVEGEPRAGRAGRRWLRPAALLAGLVLTALLLADNDWRRIGFILAGAGPGIVLVVALHLPQTLASAWAWGMLIEGGGPSLGLLYGMRWVRDSINTLLPVAQVGGDVVRVRLLTRTTGASGGRAAAATVVDIALETIAQVVFTLGAVAVLLIGSHGTDVRRLAWAVLAGSTVIAAALIAAQRSRLLRWVERLAGGERRWRWLGDLAGLQAAVLALHRQPRRLWASTAAHLAAWGFGAVETYAGLRVIGVGAGFAQAVVIEALGHAARALGFLIPGALGIQEGGYVLVCALYGIGAPHALALSAIKRVRELALGLPGLAWWGWVERERDAT